MNNNYSNDENFDENNNIDNNLNYSNDDNNYYDMNNNNEDNNNNNNENNIEIDLDSLNQEFDNYISNLKKQLQIAKNERKQSDKNIVTIKHRIDLLQNQEKYVILQFQNTKDKIEKILLNRTKAEERLKLLNFNNNFVNNNNKRFSKSNSVNFKRSNSSYYNNNSNNNSFITKKK